jgi:hypothetical protein
MLYLVAAWKFLRANWRWMLPLAGIAAVFAVLAYARHEHNAARHNAEVAQVQKQQATNNQRATEAVERIVHTETIIREKTQAAVQQVQSQPGASDELPSAVRDSLCAGLGELRGNAVCDDYDPADTPGAVPSANG